MGRDYDLESCTHDLELAQQREIVHTNESKREHFRPRTVASKLALSGLLAGPPRGSEVGYGAPGATYGFMNGPSLLRDVV